MKTLQLKCKAVQKAYDSCMGANKGEGTKCIDLERRLVECMAEKVCQKEAEAFQACVLESFNVNKRQWSTSACDQQVLAMQKGLKKYKLYPLQTQR